MVYFSASDIENLIFKIAFRDDQVAFRRFFDCFYSGLNDYARYYVKSPLNAEEVVTDVFVKIWEKREKLADVKNLQAYLYTITKREALNYIRDRKLNSNLFVKLEDQVKIDYITPEYEFLSKEAMESLTSAINNLPSRCRLVFQMVKENGLKYKEVAQLLNISEKAVGIHITKALKSITIGLSENPKPEGTKVHVSKKLMIFLLALVIA
jgi:RNA polymerase sigma-70 factor (family 1)